VPESKASPGRESSRKLPHTKEGVGERKLFEWRPEEYNSEKGSRPSGMKPNSPHTTIRRQGEKEKIGCGHQQRWH